MVNTGIESNSESAISIRNLEFAFGNRPVLNGINLEIPKDVSSGVLGANGAGKATLVRLLIGRLKPASGSAQIFGQQPGPDLADSVGYMPQLNAPYEALSVRETSTFSPVCSDSPIARSADPQ